jgi:hypothetical protein
MFGKIKENRREKRLLEHLENAEKNGCIGPGKDGEWGVYEAIFSSYLVLYIDADEIDEFMDIVEKKSN